MPAKKTATEKAQKRTETETPPSSVSSFSHSVRAVFVQYLSDLKTTGREFAVPYRHFTHWNVSKLAIFLYSFAAGFVFSVPFLLAMGAIGYYALANPAGEATTTLLSRQSVTPSLIQMVLLENMGKVAAEVVLFAFVLTIFSVFITYGYYLLANVYRGYLENAELPLRANEYFHWKRVAKFTAVLGWSSLYVLVPILVGLAAFGASVLSLADPSADAAKNLSLGVATFAITVATFTVAAYYAIRTGFATFGLLSDSEISKTGRQYVGESMAITKGRVLRIALLVLPFMIVVGIGEGTLQKTDQYFATSRMYDEAVKIKAETASGLSDSAFLEEYIDRTLDNEDRVRIVDIVNARDPQLAGIDRAFFDRMAPYLDRTELDPRASRYESFFNLLNFLLLDGLVSMAYLSVFLRIGGSIGKTTEWRKAEENAGEPEEAAPEKPKKVRAKKVTAKKKTSE